MAYFKYPDAMTEAMRRPGQTCHEARLEFLALGEKESIARICAVIDETGIFDDKEELKDNWREILAAYKRRKMM